MTERMVMKAAEPPGRTPTDWGPVVKKLQRYPGKWYLVIEGCKVSTINAIRNQAVKVLRADRGIEVRQANTVEADGSNPKRADLYLRYVKENDEEHT